MVLVVTFHFACKGSRIFSILSVITSPVLAHFVPKLILIFQIPPVSTLRHELAPYLQPLKANEIKKEKGLFNILHCGSISRKATFATALPDDLLTSEYSGDGRPSAADVHDFLFSELSEICIHPAGTHSRMSRYST